MQFWVSVAFSGFWRLKCSKVRWAAIFNPPQYIRKYSIHDHTSSICSRKRSSWRVAITIVLITIKFLSSSNCNSLQVATNKWKGNSKVCHGLDFNSEYIWVWGLWGLDFRLRNNILNIPSKPNPPYFVFPKGIFFYKSEKSPAACRVWWYSGTLFYIYIHFYVAVIFLYLQEIYYIHVEFGVVAVRISWSLKYLDKKVIYGKRKLFPSISIGILRVVLKGQFYISKESVISYIFSLRGIGKGSSQSFVTSYPNIQHSPNYGSTRSNLYHQHKSLRLYYITVSTRNRVISFFLPLNISTINWRQDRESNRLTRKSNNVKTALALVVLQNAKVLK